MLVAAASLPRARVSFKRPRNRLLAVLKLPGSGLTRRTAAFCVGLVCVTEFRRGRSEFGMGAASFRGACGDGIGGSFMPSVLRGSSFPPLGEAGPQTIMFVVGETEARREIPLSLARRLVASPIRTVNSEEKCRRSEERAKVSPDYNSVSCPIN